MLFYAYLVAAAALVPLCDLWFDVLRESWSWWLVPLLFAAFFVGFLLLHAAVTLILLCAVRLNGDPERFSGLYRAFLGATIGLLAKLLRVHIHTSGTDLVPRDTRFLLVCNHLSLIDPAILLHELPEAQLGFIAKKEIYTTMPLVARGMHKLHCLPIDRENNREAARTVVNAARLLREDKISVGLFPEGYVSKSGELLPLRNGSLKIAVRAGAPIVISTILGTPQAEKRLFFHRSEVYFDILAVIPAEKVASSDTAELGAVIAQAMTENLSRRRAEHPELFVSE